MTSLLLNKYQIIRVIGRGGMGTVYEAREVGSGRRVAVKWMHGQVFAEDDPNLLRFQQEARIAGALDSLHLTAVFECAREVEKGVVFQVMELLEGEDLRSLLHRVGALDPAVALRIATQACAGLAAAHAAGVVHRDIKPENIFLSRNGGEKVIVKLLDFGVAKIRQSRDNTSAMTVPLNSMTSSGEMLGTPLYMAPEQFDGAKHADAKADVYSMGVTLYAMLSGAPPHANSKSLLQIFRAVMTQSAPPLSQVAPWVRPAVIFIVETAMQSDRDARYPNGAAMLAALQTVTEKPTDIRERMLVGISEEQKRARMNNERTDPTTSAGVETPIATAQTVVDPKAWWKRLLGG